MLSTGRIKEDKTSSITSYPKRGVTEMPYPYKNPKQSRLSTGQAATQFIRYHGQSNGKNTLQRNSSTIMPHPDGKFIFLPGRVMTLQLLRFTEIITDKFSEWAYRAAIFRDVSKA
jgi:hypothetical protein